MTDKCKSYIMKYTTKFISHRALKISRKKKKRGENSLSLIQLLSYFFAIDFLFFFFIVYL